VLLSATIAMNQRLNPAMASDDSILRRKNKAQPRTASAGYTRLLR
jgi:hypothetical protein